MSPGGRVPPQFGQASRFSISVDGVDIGVFAELVGLTSGIDPTGLTLSRDQRRKVTLKKLPGKRPPPTVILKRGLTNGLEVWAWHEDALDRAAARRDATFAAFDSTGGPVMRFQLKAAWPAQVEIGAVQAGASQILLETVTFVAAEIQRVAV